MVENKARILKVIKTPVDTEEALPEVMKDVLGYEFFTFDDGTPLELDPAYGEKFAQEYNRKVGKLAWDAAQLLKKLVADTPGSGPDRAAPATTRPTVYLAECSYDRREARDMLESDLRLHGYTVLPEHPLPREEADYVAAVERVLGGCALSIHLVGESYGAVPDGPSQKSLVVLQNELAVQRSKSGALSRVIWLRQGTVSAHAQQQAFIAALHQDAEAQCGADLITGDLEACKAAIHAALKKLEKPERETPTEPVAAADTRLIYLLCDEKDRKATVPLRKFCREQGWTVALPAFEGDATAVREANQNLLTTCDAVILFYGAGDDAWKRTIDNELKKMPGYRGGKPLLARYTYLADPRTSDKDRPPRHGRASPDQGLRRLCGGGDGHVRAGHDPARRDRMSTAATFAVPTNPFPGLRPFREDEDYVFFGRESQVDAMVNTLAATRFLAVVGTSGSGKSSLVNCGLRPALRRGLMARAGTAWRMAQCRPGSDPLGALTRALAGDGVLFRGYEADGLTLAEIIDTTLRMSKLGLIDIYEQARLGERVNLLVVVDQFEELFRYRQLGATQTEHAYGISAEATAFVNLLLEVREQTHCSIYVVLTMRSDFLGDCAQFPGLPEAINAGQYLVPRLTRDERRAAISGPVGVGGAEIAPVLLTRLVNDVGDNPDQLSILQHALNRTWACWQQEGDGKRALDLTHYDAIGTMAHALDQHAENAYAELAGERQQHICAKLLKALTDKATDPRGVRRPTTLATLCALAVATAAEVTEVIDVFREPSRSFVMPPAGEALHPETVIDISHESLMRVWERLQAWADEEAQSARLYRRLAETAVLHAAGKASLWRDPDLQLALDWQAKEQPTAVWAARYHEGFEPAMGFLQASVARRDEEAREQEARRQEQETQRQRALEQAQALAEEQQRRAEEQTQAAKRLRWLLGIVAVLAMIAVGTAVVAVSQSRAAQQQTRLATARQLAAQALSPLVRLDRALLAIVEANRIADTVEGRGSLLAALLRSPHLTTVLTGHTSSVRSVAFSPDGKTLASGSRDKTLILWDVASRQPLGQPLTGHTDTVVSVAFSPDGRTLASGSWDKTLILWDVASRQPLGQPLTGHTNRVWSVAFSPDGTDPGLGQ